uniref:Uncharacterized protein n=1 Tax=Acrobeloides nanus TaxID=290746 RepID=A0A914DEY5_9BILA
MLKTTNKHTVKKKTHWSNEIENCNGNNNDEEDELEWTSDSILANDPWIDNNEEEEDSLEWTFGRLKFNISKDHSEEPVYLPEHLNNFIKPYQYKGVQFICDNIINNNFGIILAHSMGLEKYISEEIKKIIVEAKQKGETDQEVADRFHVNQSTVSRIFKRWREAKTVKHKKIPGRPRKITSRQNRLLVRLVKADPFKTAVGVRTKARRKQTFFVT